MSSHRERLFNNSTTTRAFLRCVGRIPRAGYLAKLAPKMLQPLPELIPARIINRLSETMILDRVLNPQVFVGNQIVRLDYATCHSLGVFFTLPTYLEVYSPDAINGSFSVGRAFFLSRNTSLSELQSFLARSIKFRVSFGMTIGVCVELLNSHIQSDDSTCRLNVCFFSFDFYQELNIVAVSSTY